MNRLINIQGLRFGRLKVIKRIKNIKHGGECWYCKCDCGEYTTVLGASLLSENTSSCGCLRRELASKRVMKHGMYGTKTHQVWSSMIRRCTSKNNKDWNRYGGRGITVCKRWQKFENFYKDMGERPNGLQIDRIDNNKGYYKENCQWVTSKQNHRNKCSNRILVFKGRSQCISEWAEELGINPYTIISRINRTNWSVERALTQPIRQIKAVS